MPLQATSGAASYDAFGGGVAAVPTYIEDIFGTFLYTGNGSTQTITNGIDLAGKGGLVWIKNRLAAEPHQLFDTVRGLYKNLNTNNTSQQFDQNPNGVSAFNSNGFSVTGTSPSWNQNNSTQVSWTFRKQPKFFDVVTYTGSGANQTISHSLGSVPGCIIIKSLSDINQWHIYHRSLGNNQVIRFTTGAATAANSTYWQTTTPTSTEFYIGSLSAINDTGLSYVAYIFAHDAGGFGLTGTDNVISCGSYTESVGSTITLGYEPQYLLLKRTNAVSGWFVFDTMRGLSDSNGNYVYANTSGAEVDAGQVFLPQATGFKQQQGLFGAGANVIYIAIRRGPMKVPTSGTSVFAPVAATAPSSPYTVTTNFPVDLTINSLSNTSSGKNFNDRLRGGTTTSYVALDSTGLAAEGTGTGFGIGFNSNTSIIDNGWESGTGNNAIWWNFRRAPSFFDEVCYTGNRVSGSTTQTLTHNLGTTPELMIVKGRSTSYDWFVYSATLGATKYLSLRSTIASTTTVNPNAYWNETAPTSTQFTVGANNNINGSGVTFVAYLFATCAGVSKVGSYTGTGTTLQVDCGFTGGARFVLIKRTDSTGDWYVWDSARGIVSGNDPYLLLNSTAAEVTSTDYIDTYSAGFEISSTAPAAINASGGTYIFLAIA